MPFIFQERKMELDEIKKILEMMNEHELSEFEMEQDGFKISLKKGQLIQVQPSAPIIMPMVPQAQPESATTQAAPVEEEAGVEFIPSPIVGTFYAAASPETPPFVEVGQAIKQNDVICVIEAMKVMNEIQSEVSGTVVEVLVSNGEPVEFDQPLFKIKKA
jgi:acetyl-CoA carboxylase biotin carboxyl carrier protein